jgi:uncharacterized membrane protein (DUF4010 family)
VGTIAACTVLLVRVVAMLLVLNAALAPGVGLGLGPMFATGVLLVLIGHRRAPDGKPQNAGSETRNPLRLGSAILMALGFQVVLTFLFLLRGRFGDSGVFASAALAGLTDMDALTFGMSRLSEDDSLLSVAARALVLGVIVNTAFKTTLALVLGSPAYRRLAVPALLLVAAAGGAGLWLTWRVLGNG